MEGRKPAIALMVQFLILIISTYATVTTVNERSNQIK